MAATITLAEPSMACATELDGLRSWVAIWAADRPASTCGSYCAPARTYRLPTMTGRRRAARNWLRVTSRSRGSGRLQGMTGKQPFEAFVSAHGALGCGHPGRSCGTRQYGKEPR